MPAAAVKRFFAFSTRFAGFLPPAAGGWPRLRNGGGGVVAAIAHRRETATSDTPPCGRGLGPVRGQAIPHQRLGLPQIPPLQVRHEGFRVERAAGGGGEDLARAFRGSLAVHVRAQPSNQRREFAGRDPFAQPRHGTAGGPMVLIRLRQAL